MKITIIVSAFLCLMAGTNTPFDASIGKAVVNVKLKNPDNKETVLPFLGEKVLAVFYNDPDAKDVNDPLSDAMKAKKLNVEKYKGIGIANCAETWLPNSAIRYSAREKEKKYPGSVILIDEDRILQKAWDLPDGNGKGFIIIVGKDSKIKYIKSVESQEESKAITQAAIAVLESEIAK